MVMPCADVSRSVGLLSGGCARYVSQSSSALLQAGRSGRLKSLYSFLSTRLHWLLLLSTANGSVCKGEVGMMLSISIDVRQTGHQQAQVLLLHTVP
jgi:hypothetical protein